MTNKRINELKTKLEEINTFVASLDPSIRLAAFEILKPYYFEEIHEEPQEHVIESKDIGYFMNKFDHTKPSDNILLIIAWLFSQHGVFMITKKIIDKYASKIGLTVPKRPDMTMKNAKYKKKSLFIKKGNGYEVTVNGELYLKNTYKVEKGKKPIPEEEKT